MIGADGRTGLLGRGLYTAPPELFARALSMQQSAQTPSIEAHPEERP